MLNITKANFLIDLSISLYKYTPLITGEGHNEMNAIRAFLDLNWTPFMECLGELLGFKSPSAQDYFHRGKDHHINWRVLKIFYTSGLEELTYHYLRSTNDTPGGNAATVEGFKEFYLKNENANLKYLYITITRYAQALVNFRMGIRRNNNWLVASAKYHFKELYYARNHPNYAQIEIFDRLQAELMPKEVKQIIDMHTSFTVSGSEFKGQGIDFVLEEINRRIKQYLPSGQLPSDETWNRICCNLASYESHRSNFNEMVGLDTYENTLRDLKIEEPIKAFRAELRLYMEEIKSNSKHFSMKGKALHENLVCMTELCKEKRKKVIAESYLGKKKDSPKNAVIITKEEEARLLDPQNWDKTRIKKEIKTKIAEMKEQESKPIMNQKLKQAGSSFQKLLQLYLEVQLVC